MFLTRNSLCHVMCAHIESNRFLGLGTSDGVARWRGAIAMAMKISGVFASNTFKHIDECQNPNHTTIPHSTAYI